MKRHELTRRDLINSVGAAAIGLAAATLASCASSASSTAEPSAGPKSTTASLRSLT